MTFVEFAISFGLVIDHVVNDRWVRVPTVDHPQKRNGSYKFVGNVGWVQNFATMETPALWKDRFAKPMPFERRAVAEKDVLFKQSAAARKAATLINHSTKATHPYLTAKGFPDFKGVVWNGLLVLPMRVGSSLVGAQLIGEDGSKKFLAGQRTKGASLTIDAKGQHFVCEGFATALSVRRAMKHLGKRYTITVAFSAGNMVEVSKGLGGLLVIADHDAAGIAAAKKIGRYWLGGEGQDFNDFEMRHGTEAAAESLNAFLVAS